MVRDSRFETLSRGISSLIFGLSVACGRVEVTDGTDPVSDPDAEVSEVLASLAQARSGPMFETELYTFDIAGHGVQRLVSSHPYNYVGHGGFSWSPDGSALVYQAIPLDAETFSGATELFLAGVDDAGSAPSRVELQLEADEVIGFPPEWGSDSRSIHWTVESSGGVPLRKYWMDLEDRSPLLVPQRLQGVRTAWSSDGYRYVYEEPDYISSVVSGQLFLVDFESGSPSEPLPMLPSLPKAHGLCDWRWSASERWMLYSAEAEGSECSLYAVRVEGGAVSTPRRLDPGLRAVKQLYRAPDLDRVVFTGLTDSGVGLFFADLDVGEPEAPPVPLHSLPFDFTFSFTQWLDSERFIYETLEPHVPTAWLADLRLGQAGVRRLDLPLASSELRFQVIPNATNDSVRVLYRACAHLEGPDDCNVREWTWLDLTGGGPPVPLGIFCDDSGHVAFSPDGRWAVVDARANTTVDPQERDLFVLELRDGPPGSPVRVDHSHHRLLLAGRPIWATWSATGYAFAFLTEIGELFWATADGTRVHRVSQADTGVPNFDWRPR